MPELRAELRAHMLASGRRAGLVFGKDGTTPFHDSTVTRSARKTWSECDPPMVGLELHEFRHSAITSWIEAGVNPKRVSRWAGHADVALTLRVYAKAFLAQEPDEAAKVASYLHAAKQPKNDLTGAHTGAHPLQKV